MSRRIGRELLRVGRVTVWTLLAAALNFAAGVIIARALGPSGRGFVSVMVSLAGLVSIAAAAGTNLAFRALLPKGDSVNLKGYAVLTIWLGVVSVPLLVGTGLVAGSAVDSRMLAGGSLILFVLFGLTNLFWLQAKEALNATGQIAAGAWIGALGSGLFLGLVAAVAPTWPGIYSGILVSYILMNGAQIAVSAVLLRKLVRPGPPRGAGCLLRSGPGYLSYVFGQELALKLDRTLIGAFSSTYSVGLFSVAAGIAEILRLPVLASSQYVLLHTAQGGLSVKGVMLRVGFWVFLVSLVAGVLWPLAPGLLIGVYGPEFAEAVTPFRVLIIAQVLLTPFLVISRGLIGLGQRWVAGVPGVAGLVVLLVMAPVLIRPWGATGGALACAGTSLTMSIVALALLFQTSRSRGKPRQ